MQLKEFYKEVGGDYEDVLLRLPNPEMIRCFLLKFLEDPFYAELHEALDKGDFKAAFLAACTLKDTAANLGLNILVEAASDMATQLHEAVEMPAKCFVDALDIAYRKNIEDIRGLSEKG